ncbi:MAG: ribonuclease R [Melioribacteraceae bacterium]|nr:ribonuclease R [Melioribacteraceae bacterium]
MKKEIKAYFRKHPSIKIKPRDLAKKLNAREPHIYAKLKDILFKLTKEEYLEREGKRYSLKIDKEEKQKSYFGVVQIIDDGKYGFVVLKDSIFDDVFIAERNLGNALNGDKVEIEIFEKQRGKSKEGKIIDILERKHQEIIGKLEKSGVSHFVIPDKTDFHRDVFINKKNLKGAKDGDKVIVSDIKWAKNAANPEGKITEKLGKAGTHEADILSIAKEFNLRHKFPPIVLNHAKNIDVKIKEDEIKKRMDLRDKNIFTIDPDDAKDYDDAVSIEEQPNGNFLIGIHIADVSHYLEENSPIFKGAKKRGTSVYLVGNVIPMLPEKLSNQVCSLVPNEDRLTFSVMVEMTPRGKVENYKIGKSVINSKRRFTYDEVQNILENKKGEFYDELCKLNNIALKLRKKRMSQGSINFHTPEVDFTLDKNGKPIGIKVKEIKDSNKLVEEYMLLANQIVAKHINKNRKNVPPFVYRVHDLPDEEKLNEFANFVKSLGFSFDPKSASNAQEFQKVLEQVEGTPDDALVNEVAIRSMAKAIYSTENIGHFGLGFKFYTHFTSPIRRFPDLIIHKLLFRYLHGGKPLYNQQQLENISEDCSAQERTAVSAERLSVKLKQIQFMNDKVGEEFKGVISGITNFGMFIELRESLAEGLIRLRDIKDDFYIFDEKQYAIIGQDTEKKYRLGDEVEVKLIRVDELKKEIDFALLN